MAVPFTSTTGSASISTSEISLISGTTTLQASTTAGDIEAWIDLSNMVAGDVYQVRVVEKVNGGTAQNAFISFPKDVQVGLYRVGPLRVGEGWDVRVKLSTGSARTVNWSLRQYVGDVNTATISSGAITSSAIASNAIGATQIASSAITSAKFATDAIDSNAVATSAVTEIQSGLATSTALAAVSAQLPTSLDGNGNIKAGVQTIAAGAITASSIASAAITAAKFATDAIDSNALATSAVTEIQSGLATSSAVASIQSDTDDIQTRLPATLDGSGFIKAGVQSIVAGAITATSIASAAITAAKFATDAIDANALAASAVTEIQSGLATSSAVASIQSDTDDIQTRLPTALDGNGNIKAGVQTIATGAITATSIAAAAITAAKFATDAIDANALAASAVTEIQTGLATSSALASVQSDTDDIQSRLPTTLDGNGNIKAGVQTILAGAVTASSIASAAITAAKFATDAIDSNVLAASAVTEIQTGLATSSSLANVQTDIDDIQARLPTALDSNGNIKAGVQTIATGAITATSIAAASITSAKFATDAIDSNALAASAVSEIQSGLATSSALAAVQTDTDDIQTRLPTSLDGNGNIKAGVQTLASGIITSSSFALDAIDSNALAASAVSEIQSGLATATALANVQADTDDIQIRLPTALDGSGNIKAAVQSVVTGAITASSIASAAITAAKFATDAIDSNALATSAVTEIQTGLATSGSIASISSQIAGVQADTDDIQTRLPATLDGSGNIKASVQSLIGSAVSTISDAVSNYVIEATPTNATTRIQRERVIWSILAAVAQGLGLSTDGHEVFLSADGTKPRATFDLVATAGTRTPGTFDGTP